MKLLNSIFSITEENIKVELFADNFDEFSFGELKDELEEMLSISDVTPYTVQHEKTGPRNFEAYRKLGLEKSSTVGYIFLLMGFSRAPFRDFESYLMIVIVLDEDEIQLILKQCFSNFVTYELSQGIYLVKDIVEAVYTVCDHEGTLQIELMMLP